MPDYRGSVIDHLNIAVPNLDRSVAFYTPVLATLDIVTLLVVPEEQSGIPTMHGYGQGRKPFFWLVAGGKVGDNMHLAFTADSRETVRAFYRAAMSAGATSRIEPGPRTDYHPDYYGAFVDDPDGINLEAVCHEPE